MGIKRVVLRPVIPILDLIDFVTNMPTSDTGSRNLLCHLSKILIECSFSCPVHEGETRAIRAARPAKMAELKELAKIINTY